MGDSVGWSCILWRGFTERMGETMYLWCPGGAMGSAERCAGPPQDEGVPDARRRERPLRGAHVLHQPGSTPASAAFHTNVTCNDRLVSSFKQAHGKTCNRLSPGKTNDLQACERGRSQEGLTEGWWCRCRRHITAFPLRVSL